MADKKRRAINIQDMTSDPFGDDLRTETRRKSSYSGPKRAPGGPSRPSTRSIDEYDRGRRTAGSTYVNTIDGFDGPDSRFQASRQGSSSAGRGNGGTSASYAAPYRPGGILDYAWIAYSAVLALCLMTAMIAYSKTAKSDGRIYYPRDVLTVNGIMDQIYEEYLAGDLGKAYKDAQAAAQEANSSQITGNETVLGGVSSMPNATAGASMALDAGAAGSQYPEAGSHEDLVLQIADALSKGDYEFVGQKLAYEAEGSNALLGYPQSVVTHFTEYMAANDTKRELFISEIGNADYTAKNGDAFVVKLPLLKFTVNMGYDDSTLSISGFSDQHLDAGQSATVQPLLPCMYTISVSTNGKSQSSEVEANMGEGNLAINIGVVN